MQRTQILLEPEQHKALVEIARREKRSLSDLVREMVEKQLEERKKQDLTMAAKALLADYQGDAELTAFTALDAEDFHA
jgi:predicted DNA-binding protein